MKAVRWDVRARFERALDSAAVTPQARGELLKWLRYYLDFCAKYGFPPDSQSSVPAFMAKLASKHQDGPRCRQAARAVEIYQGMSLGPRQESTSRPSGRPADQRRDNVAHPEEAAKAGRKGRREQRREAEDCATGDFMELVHTTI